MHAEAAIGRTGLWFAVLIVSILVFMTAADSGFAAHAVIVGITAFALMAMSAARFDPLGKAQGFFKMPEGPSKYDDDVIRWGVIATMFWGMAGLLVGVFIASQLAFPPIMVGVCAFPSASVAAAAASWAAWWATLVWY